MNMNKNVICGHKTKAGKNAIVFDDKRWFGVYPKKIKGICKICLTSLEFTEDEYNKIVGGDNN